MWCWRRLLRVSWTAWWSNQSILWKSFQNTHWIDWCWSWNSNTLATWCEELIHWKRPWCWERLKVGGEGNDRGWDSWMTSLTWWTWASSRSWWWTSWQAAVHGVAKSRTRVSDWTELRPGRVAFMNRASERSTHREGAQRSADTLESTELGKEPLDTSGPLWENDSPDTDILGRAIRSYKLLLLECLWPRGWNSVCFLF